MDAIKIKVGKLATTSVALFVGSLAACDAPEEFGAGDVSDRDVSVEESHSSTFPPAVLASGRR